MVEARFEKKCSCQNKNYKLIMMDLQMPIMDGFEASEKILELFKSFKDENKPQICAVTSYQTLEQRCLNIGMKKVYNKPMCSTDIKEAMCLYFYRFTAT